jgi:hypothetical protein
MQNAILISLAGILAGAAMLVFGFLRHQRANAYKTVPCLPIGSMPAGEQLFITGKVVSPAHTSSPVSKTPCAFYLSTVERKVPDYSSGRSTDESRWELVSSETYGGFFVQDGSGTALVVPTQASADIQKPETTENDDLLGGGQTATRRTEQIIQQGEKVTVLGTPRTLKEFMEQLRSGRKMDLPTDFVEELVKLESGPGALMPSFFGGGVERVADRAHDDYVEGKASSAAFYMQIGALIALISAGFLFHAVKSGMPPPVF